MTSPPSSRAPGPATTATRGSRAARWRQAAALGSRRAVLHALAVGGDPVAAVLRGSPSRDPYRDYERIRARGPVVASPVGVHAVTSAELCTQVLRDPRFGVRHADGSPLSPGGGSAVEPTILAGSFLELDPPDHTRLRRVAAPAFRPRLVRAWAPRLEAVMHDLLDQVEHRCHGRPEPVFDLVAEVAAPFPIAVISELLGIPGTDAGRFAEIGAVVGQGLDGPSSLAHADELTRAGVELEALFTRLLAERRAAPRDDVLGTLAAAQHQDTVDADEVVAICGLLLIAGFETTVNLIGNAVAALHAVPARWRELLDDPDLAPAVVEETLRWDPSVQMTLRAAHEPVELAGRLLPAGTVVMPILAAGNRDPAVHPHPAVFDPHRYHDPERREADHLSFSAGIHYCLGAPLARLETDVALRVLARRLPGLALRPAARRRPGATIRGFRSLPATTR